jgi:hypothetical protein
MVLNREHGVHVRVATGCERVHMNRAESVVLFQSSIPRKNFGGIGEWAKRKSDLVL